jgi:tetratricopeptide (TPR) repeat protein
MAIAELANQKNIPFAGHIPYEIPIYQAMEAGMASSEHFLGILLACSSNEDSLRTIPSKERLNSLIGTFSNEKFDSLCEVLAQSEMWLCPTLTVNRALSYLNDTTFTNDERLAYLPKYIIIDWNPETNFLLKDDDDDEYQRWRNRFHFELKLIGMMNEKGVKILAGTDYPNPFCFPGFSLHDELSLMVDGGMSELEAIKTATINGAIFMEKEEEFGTVEVGKLASLVLLNRNPLDNIENTKSIETVILRGEVFNRIALDEMLEQAKTNAALIAYSDWLRTKIFSRGIEKALDSLDILIATESKKYKLDEYDINMLGYDYLYTGETEIAVNIFKKIIDLFPESSNAYDSYAEGLFKNGQYELAIENYNRSMEIDPSNSNAKLMLDSIENLKMNQKILIEKRTLRMYKRHAPIFVLSFNKWQIPDIELVYYEIFL